jgi:hypothetical protein
MPFVTVVTLGSSAATEFLAKGSEGSRLTGIREMCENDLYDDYPFSKNKKKDKNDTVSLHDTGKDEFSASRKRSVSFVDLSIPPPIKGTFGTLTEAESGYSGSPMSSGSSSNSSSSSSSCGSDTASTLGAVGLNSFTQSKSEADLLLPNGANHTYQSNISTTVINGTSSNNSPSLFLPSANLQANNSSKVSLGGGTIQGKANIWKTWIRSKLNLAKNGKYSFEGNSAVLGHFGIKAVMIITLIKF